jgi:outer membrane receptor protein involved in Fe transport
MNKNLKPVVIALAGVYALLGAAHAADLAKSEKIEVISSTPLQSTGLPVTQVPTNVHVFSSEEIKEQSASNMAELLDNNLGNVSVSNGVGNPYQNDVSYRGFQATSLLGAPTGLSVYFDGVRFNEPFGSNVNWDLIPMNAISGINLMPGSNPLFGLNTLGGALAVSTKNGKDFPGFSATVLGGSFGRGAFRFEGGGIDNDHNLDYFVSGNFDHQDGWRDHSSSDVQQLFGKVRWHSDDNKSNLDLSVALADNTMHGTQALPLSMLSDPKSAYTWPDHIGNRMALINLKASTWLSDTKLLAGNVYYRKQDANAQNSNVGYDDGCEDQGLGNNGNANNCYGLAPNGTVANTLTAPLARYTADINTSNVYSSTKQDTIGTNIQFSNFDNLMGHANNMTVGGVYDHSRIRYTQNTQLARLINYQVVSTPNLRYPTSGSSGYFAVQNDGLISNVNLKADTDNFSIFGTDNFEVNEKLNVTVSGSYNVAFIDQKGSNNQYLNDDGGATWAVDATSGFYNPGYTFPTSGYTQVGDVYTRNSTGVAYSPAPDTQDLGGKHHYSRFNPALGFNYNPYNELGFFGGYNESMRAPTPIELSCADPLSPCNLPTGFNGDPDLKAVVSKTWEGGARGKLLDNKIAWSMAVYRTENNNDIQFATASPTTGYFHNVGKTERKGFEFGVQGKFEKLMLAANYGYVDATYQTPFDITAPDNSNNYGGIIHVSKGNKIPGIADQTLKLRAAYDVLPIWKVGTNVLLVSPQYAHGDENNQDVHGKVPGYGVVNLDTQLKINQNWTAFALVNNLFDKTYQTYGMLGMNVYNNTSEQFRTPATERSAWVGVTYNFGGAKKSAVDND